MRPEVQTQRGRLRGLSEDGLNIFLGIPYAEPPVGNRRFRAPVPVRPWQGVRDAVKAGPACPQPPGLAQDLKVFAEDCLYLNVYAPTSSARGARLPVMVWVHGGGFTMGAGTQDLYDARELARKNDLVVVTLNYRLGVFGFGGLAALLPAELEVTHNNGLRDQLTALSWVQENIASFGGDPERVTAFGQSAGSMSLASLLCAQGAAGLFHGAICQSGGASHAIESDEAARLAERFLSELDIKAAHAQRLWDLDADTLLRAQGVYARETVMRGPVGAKLPQTAMTLLPVVDGDLLLRQPLETLRAGAGVQVPMLTGVTTDEWHFFIVPQLKQTGDMEPEKLAHLVTRNLGGEERGAIELYRNALSAEHARENWRILSAIESDRVFRLPVIRMAEAQRQKQPVFMYRFEWQTRAMRGLMGACHAADLPFVFDTLQSPLGKAFTGDTPAARALSARMIGAWTSFARSGNPSCEAVGDWPTYDEGDRATMRLGDELGLCFDPDAQLRLFWDGIQ